MSTRSLFSPTAEARKISFSPSNASRATAFAMKHNLQSDVDAIEMQMELSELRKRIKILDSNTGRNELLNRLKEREEENQRAQQQLRTLNDKFHQVHKGLVQIDEEREKLRSAKEQLEKEKKEIQRQLDIREKEVLLLAKRCSSQEERMKESSKLRASNNELSTKMEDLRTSLSLRDEEISQIDSLKRELKECQDSRQELLARLSKLKKDHDDVVETLNSCFQNIQKMNESKAEVEEERKREIQRAQLEIEKQRLAHLDATNELRAELQLRQDRIEQMEGILKENVSVCTNLRKEKAEWNTNLQLQLSKLKKEYAAERAALNRENDRLVQTVHDEYDSVLGEMRSKLEEKDDAIASLEDEVSKCMENMKDLSTDLQTLREEKSFESAEQAKAIETLEEERDALEELVSSRDQEITKLSESIAALGHEKNLLSSQLIDLRDRIKELEEENAFIMDLENRLHDVNTSIVEVKEQKYLEREEYEMTLALLQQELDDERSMWASMEQGLQEKIASLEKKNQVAKEESVRALSEARQVLHSLKDASSTMEDALKVSLREVSKERNAREGLENELSCVKASLIESEANSVNDREKIEVLETELAKVREESNRVKSSSEVAISALRLEIESARELHDTELACITNTMQFKENALDSLQTELREVRESGKKEVACLQERLKEGQNEISTLRLQLSKARITVGTEATASQRILSEKDATITALTSEIDALKTEASAQEEIFRRARSLHEDQVLQMTNDLEALVRTLEIEKDERAKEIKFNADALNKVNAELTELRATSESELANRNKQLLDQRTQLSSLESELTSVKAKAAEEVTEIKRQMAFKAEELVMLEVQFNEYRQEMSQNHDASRKVLQRTKREIESLQDMLKAEREESEKVQTSLREALAEKDEKIMVLKAEVEQLCKESNENESCYCREVEARDTAIESLQKELVQVRDASAAAEASNKATLSEKLSIIARLQTDLSEAWKTLEQKDLESFDALNQCEKSLAVAKAELDQVRSEADIARTLAEETIAERDSRIESLRFDLEDVQKALTKEKRSSNVALEEKEETILSLQAHVANLQLQAEREKATLKNKLAEKEGTIELLRTELDDLYSSKESGTAMLEKRIEAKDELIESLKSDVDDLLSHSEKEARSLREQITRLKIELQKVSTNLAIRDDEIRDLKLIDIKEAEETIAALESQLASTRKSSGQREADAARDIAELQSRVEEMKTTNKHLEQKISDVSRQHNKTSVALSDEITALTQAKEDADAHARELADKLQERHSSLSVLSRKNALLEQRERTLQSQLDSAENDVRRAKEQHEKALAALDFEIKRHRTNREDDDINFQRKCVSLQIDLEDTKVKLAAQKERADEAERVLQERTKLLGDMVTSNKETEDEKEQALALIVDLQEAVDRLEEECKTAKQDLAEVRELQRTREDQLLETIHDEQHSREIAEADLEAARAKLRSIKHEKRDVNELEKENMVLKDKVRRQEDYLKRKLQKEKVLRDRNTRNVMATPKHIPSPTKRRTVPGSVGVKTTASMSIMSESSSFPDESWDASSYRS